MSGGHDWVADEENRAGCRHTSDALRNGMVIEGVVNDLVDFGASVDLGVIDGLIHVSELSDALVDYPGEIVTEGEKVRVEVLKVDRERERVYLSLKRARKENRV